MAVGSFSEVVVFLMVFPFVNKPEETSLSVVKGLLIAGVLLTLVVARNTGVLGITNNLFTYSSWQAVRLLGLQVPPLIPTLLKKFTGLF